MPSELPSLSTLFSSSKIITKQMRLILIKAIINSKVHENSKQLVENWPLWFCNVFSLCLFLVGVTVTTHKCFIGKALKETYRLTLYSKSNQVTYANCNFDKTTTKTCPSLQLNFFLFNFFLS